MLADEANKYLVGGVNSPVRSFKSVGIPPLFLKKAKGAKVYDYNNREYIDYVLGFGAHLLGHADKRIISQINNALKQGFSLGATNHREVELAKLINGAISFMEQVRFVNSGTEAVMGALRLARAYTGRDIVIKFEHSYHGHADYLLANAGSGLSTFNIALSSGVPKEYLKNTAVFPLNDKEKLSGFLKSHHQQVAAIIIEPVGGNHGIILPNKDFLTYLRNITREYGIALVFDEVITGFRFCFGAFADHIGIEPDLICLGKIIGGGLPIGAYGGKRSIMQLLVPQGNVYQASTFGGHPVVMQAGLAVLGILGKQRSKYNSISKLTGYLSRAILNQAAKNKIGLRMDNYGSMFSFKFDSEGLFNKFYELMLKSGVYFAPSTYEANFLSFSHKKQDINFTISAAEKIFKKLKGAKV
ncbi:MAG: glutamate-1-semialdehyde 2,1-aminomutase [Candidatus Omnitrophota bacterium]